MILIIIRTIHKTLNELKKMGVEIFNNFKTAKGATLPRLESGLYDKIIAYKKTNKLKEKNELFWI